MLILFSIFIQSNISFSNTILVQVLLLSIFLTFYFYFSIFCCPDISRWTGPYQEPPSHPYPHPQVLTSHTYRRFLPASRHRPLIPEMLRTDQKKKRGVSQVSLSKSVFLSLKNSFLLLSLPQSGEGRHTSASSTVFPHVPIEMQKRCLLQVWRPAPGRGCGEHVDHTVPGAAASRQTSHLASCLAML